MTGEASAYEASLKVWQSWCHRVGAAHLAYRYALRAALGSYNFKTVDRMATKERIPLSVAAKRWVENEKPLRTRAQEGEKNG